MAKAATQTNDEIRGVILQYFYDRNHNATSRSGKKGSCVKILKAKQELKALGGLASNEVQGNLTYLTGKGWINVVEDKREIVRPSGAKYPSASRCYEISPEEIDRIEGASQFRDSGKFAGIKIDARGINVVTVGDGNLVHPRFMDVRSALEELREEVVESGLEEAEKLSVVADIQAIEAQLVKPEPNRNVVRTLWQGIKASVVATDFGGLVARAGELIDALP